MKMDAMEMDGNGGTNLWTWGGLDDLWWNDFEEVWLQCCSRAWARVRVSVGVAVQDLEVAAIEAIAAGPLCQRPTCLTDLLSETLFR